MKTLKQLKEYDIYEIDSKDIIKVFPESYESKDLFKEGVVRIKESTGDMYYYVNSEKRIVEVYTYSSNDYSFDYIVTVKLNESIGGFKDIKIIDTSRAIKFKNISEKIAFNKEIKNSIGVFICALMYMSYLLENQETIIKTSSKRNSSTEKTNSKTNYKKSIKVISKDKIIYKIITNNSSVTKDIRHFQRHIDSWNVRGHVRHYKSGKTIWIEPYQKGKGKIKSKIYIIK